MATNQDYYSILGVPKTASEAELKAAYRKLALQWHPDRNKDPKASEKFKEINEAYEVLGNPEKKAAYDQFGHAAFQQGNMNGAQGPFGGASGGYQQGPFTYTYRTYGAGSQQNPFEGIDFGGFSDPFEIFEQFFGGGFNAGGPRRPRRQAYSLTISFLEAAKGTEKTVEVGGRSMKIKIPAGVDDGSRVRFGDFDIVVAVHSDKIFQRDGLDIHVNVELSYPDAVLGTTIDVPTIDGPVSLKIAAGTQPNSLIRLRGHGIKVTSQNMAGDEYVRIKITVPSKLSSREKQLLEELKVAVADSKKRSGWF